jgi:hypothetical protein|tara:strand:+ start:1415 stop:1744 length:330 start_codon:yes stop_codon:yes gene_type:complete
MESLKIGSHISAYDVVTGEHLSIPVGYLMSHYPNHYCEVGEYEEIVHKNACEYGLLDESDLWEIAGYPNPLAILNKDIYDFKDFEEEHSLFRVEVIDKNGRRLLASKNK